MFRVSMATEIKTEEDLLPPGAPVGTVPTDLDQSTGLERLEILGKMQGVDIFDMKPLPSDRKGTIFSPSSEQLHAIIRSYLASTRLLTFTGTMQDPIIVRSFGEEQYVGCCGVPADSHHQLWLVVSRDRPIERCAECGNVIKMEYVGPQDDGHGHEHDHGHGEHADH